MKQGDSVEVNKVWASNGKLQAPSRGWFGGYVFESTDGYMTRVRAADGCFRDCVAVYPSHCVRGVES